MRFTAAVLVVGSVSVGTSARAEPRALHAAAPSTVHSVALLAEPAASPVRRSAEVELTDEGELAKVVGLYEAGKYADCATDLTELLDPDSGQALRDPKVVESARIYLAACLIGSGKPEAADEPLRAAIRENVQMKPPDSLLFPPPVVERFLRVRQSLYEEIRKAEAERLQKARKEAERRLERERTENERVLELERLASRETILIKNRRWIGFVPFGVGQFQNGNEGLGWVFLTSEAVLGATALTALGVYSHLHREAAPFHNPENEAVVTTWKTLFDVSSYSFLAVAALGILEAQISFVPEVREQRVRPLPERLRSRSGLHDVRARVGAAPDGIVLGVSGRF